MSVLVKMSCCIHAMLHHGCSMHAWSAKYTLSSLIYYYLAAGLKSINLTVHVCVYLCKLTHRILCNHDINFMTAGICEPAGLLFMVISVYKNACIIYNRGHSMSFQPKFVGRILFWIRRNMAVKHS